MTTARTWLRRGFYWSTLVPVGAFALALSASEALPPHWFDMPRAQRTAFPDAADISIAVSIFAVVTSTYAAVMFARSIPVDRLGRFRSAVMLKKNSSRPATYDIWPPVVAASMAAACIFLLLWGPADMAVLSVIGSSISKSPLVFGVTQLVLCVMAYACIACLSLWITSYIKLRKS